MLMLHPEIRPYAEHRLQVDERHNLYVEESGNPKGIPVLVVHGGPGAGCQDYQRRFFPAEHFRIILFDQRGAGRSTPLAELEDNTTWHLVADIERIRELLGIEQWMLFGGSWGSTLSLVYAQAYPERVLGLVLRGIFLCRPEELDWFYRKGGASRVFPDYWRDFEAAIPEAEREEPIAAFYRRLTSENELERIQAAKAWSIWEGRCATLHPNQSVVEHCAHPHVAIALARIECHYFLHQGFLEPNQILRDAYKLRGIPGIIVHGRYDMICPVDNAFALNEAWDSSQLHIIRDAGHAATEPSILDGLLRAVHQMSNRLRPGGGVA